MPPELRQAVTDTIEAAPPPRSVEEVKAMLEGTEKGGVRNSIHNCLTVFQYDPILSGAVAKNLLTERIDLLKPIGRKRRTGSKAMTDTDMKYIRLYLEDTYGLTSEKKIADAADLAADANSYHPIRDYLNGLVWDGKERIRYCLRHFLGADTDNFTYHSLRLFLLGAIHRAFCPGCKFEVMLCLVGGQGAGKSTFFRLLAVKDEWFSDEPLVDRKTFDIVQRKLKSRQRPRQTGEISLFAGLIKCGECGKSLTIRYTNEKHPKQIYSCKTYNAYGKQHCSQHRVEYDTLYRLVLNKIRECARAALMDGEAVAGKLSDTCEAEQKGQREALERSLAKDEERIDVLEKMVLRLYEDMVAGRISEANFNLLMEKTQKEQAELKARVEEGRKKLADEIRLAYDARQWVEAIQEYADITELDAATLNRLIKEIVVHESIDSDKTRHISIEIHFNLKPLPEVEQVTA